MGLVSAVARAGAAYSALVRLGEIDNCLRYGDLPEPLVRKAHTAIHRAAISDEVLAKASAEAKGNLARLKQMLSVGTRFTYEELLLAITMRVELELLEDFLRGRGMAVEFDARSLDDDLLEVARYHQNSSAFRSAQIAAKRNWGLPLRSQWLEERTEH